MPQPTKHPGEVSDDYIQAKTTPSLKRDFKKAVEEHPDLTSMTHFLEECMKTLILQMRQGSTPAFPLEFVAKQPPERRSGAGR